MIKVLITEKEKSNKPVAVLSLQTQAKVIDHWGDMLINNPDKYYVQIIMEYIFNEECSENWHSVFSGLLYAYQSHKGQLSEEEINCAFIGTLQGLAYAIERKEHGKDNNENSNPF